MSLGTYEAKVSVWLRLVSDCCPDLYHSVVF